MYSHWLHANCKSAGEEEQIFVFNFWSGEKVPLCCPVNTNIRIIRMSGNVIEVNLDGAK